MSVTKDQARRAAQILYPSLWLTNRVEAVAKAIEFLHEAAGDNDSNEDQPEAIEAPGNHVRVGRPAPIIKELALYMKRHGIHVNVVARAVQVSPYTVRTWMDAKYRPNEENSKKIADFIAGSPDNAEKSGDLN